MTSAHLQISLFRRCIQTVSLLVALSATQSWATNVSCPQGLTWVFDGYCKKLLVGETEICPPKSKKAKVSAMAPLICMAEGVCPPQTAPDTAGTCVPVAITKCPARFPAGTIIRCNELGHACTPELKKNLFIQCAGANGG